MKKLMTAVLLCVLSWFLLPVQAAGPDGLVEGQSYYRLSPAQPTLQPRQQGQVEVLEFVWYGCPTCYALQPQMLAWHKKQPADVHLIRLPALQGDIWDVHGRILLTLNAMQATPEQHMKVFDAIHQQHLRLATLPEIRKFVATLGMDADAFEKIYTSEEMAAEVKKVKALTIRYGLKGVPAVVIDGTYRFDIDDTEGPERFMAQLDALVRRVKQAHSNVQQ